MNEETALDVLQAADMYLMKGLVRQCAVFLGKNLNIDNVLAIHSLARLFCLPRLEDQCVIFMAQNFDQVSDTTKN